MKTTKIKGFIKELEDKNKNFSYDKTMRMLNVSNYVYLDIIRKFNYNNISKYKNSMYLFKEIAKEFDIIFEFLSNGEILISFCLLRNVYEEILYIMATSLDIELDINVQTKAGYFKDIVIKNNDRLLTSSFNCEDISELYRYLSKIVHITNIKEAASDLIGKRNIKKYIINEIKYVTLLIEYLYLDFLHKKCNLDSTFITNIFAMSSYYEIINAIYFTANTTKYNKSLKKYFYGEKNQKYLKNQQERLFEELETFKVKKNNIDISIKKILKEVVKQLKERNYIDIAEKILNNKK